MLFFSHTVCDVADSSCESSFNLLVILYLLHDITAKMESNYPRIHPVYIIQTAIGELVKSLFDVVVWCSDIENSRNDFIKWDHDSSSELSIF